jgi:hypothetical protein
MKGTTTADLQKMKPNNEIWKFDDGLVSKRKLTLCPTTQSRYTEMDIIVSVGRDESVNNFDPNVDLLAGEDASIFNRLSQEAKGKNIHMPPPSPCSNPYLPEKHSNNKAFALHRNQKGEGS